ncbi:MAG TPA: hypothetical protein VNF50_09475 [Acidimicrobiales bacterium]|nr:hypothetical protein [Acidimicrobiales bacterium]
MKIKPRKLAAIGMAGMAATAALGLVAGTPAHAAIVNPSLVMSNNQSASTSTYTYTFTPGLTVTQILSGFNGVVGLPGGASGLSGATVSVYSNTGSGWGSALAGVTSTVSTAGNVLGIAVPSADFTGITSIPQLEVVVSNLTNPTVSVTTTAGACVADALSALSGIAASTFTSGTSGSGASFSSTLATLLADTSCLTSTVVPLGTNGVTEQLSVAPVLNVTLPQTSDSFSVTPTAAGVAVSFPTDTITVATNALNYTIEALIANSSSALKYDGSGSYSLPITATTGTCGSAAALGSGGTYNALASSLSGLTNGTATSVTYCGSNVNLTSPPGSYSGTITYLVVPSF